MLPSMYSSVENEVFPPDVCYSGETNSPSPPNWGTKAGCESQDSEVGSDVENSEDVNFSESEVVNECDCIHEEIIEGAVGGILPDLCNTGCRISSLSLDDDNEISNSDCKLPSEVEKLVLSSKDLPSDMEESSQVINFSNNEISEYEETRELDIGSKTQGMELTDSDLSKYEDKALTHKNINLLPCETGDLESKHTSLESKGDISNLCTVSPISTCDMFGALEKEKIVDVEKLGLDLVRRNVIHSSHPSYHEWKCSAVIPSYLLSPVSLHSHGTSLGDEVGASIFLGTSRLSEGESNSEDEQIKMAKRFGLIRHLPCGVFDGSTKTRECVICMIDFSVGDRVRYLPCMHTYHTDCIDDWLIRSFTCPSCLEPVDAALLSTYETT